MAHYHQTRLHSTLAVRVQCHYRNRLRSSLELDYQCLNPYRRNRCRSIESSTNRLCSQHQRLLLLNRSPGFRRFLDFHRLRQMSANRLHSQDRCLHLQTHFLGLRCLGAMSRNHSCSQDHRQNRFVDCRHLSPTLKAHRCWVPMGGLGKIPGEKAPRVAQQALRLFQLCPWTSPENRRLQVERC